MHVSDIGLDNHTNIKRLKEVYIAIFSYYELKGIHRLDKLIFN